MAHVAFVVLSAVRPDTDDAAAVDTVDNNSPVSPVTTRGYRGVSAVDTSVWGEGLLVCISVQPGIHIFARDAAGRGVVWHRSFTPSIQS